MSRVDVLSVCGSEGANADEEGDEQTESQQETGDAGADDVMVIEVGEREAGGGDRGDTSEDEKDETPEGRPTREPRDPVQPAFWLIFRNASLGCQDLCLVAVHRLELARFSPNPPEHVI